MKSDINNQKFAQVVCEVEDATQFRLQNNLRQKQEFGFLRLAWLPESRIYFLSVSDYAQIISPEMTIVTIFTSSGLALLLPRIDSGLNGIFIPGLDHARMFSKCLSTIVQIVPYERAIDIPQFQHTIEYQCRNILSNPLESEPSIADYFVKGGQKIKKGFRYIFGSKHHQQQPQQSENVKQLQGSVEVQQLSSHFQGEEMKLSSEQLKQLFVRQETILKAGEIRLPGTVEGQCYMDRNNMIIARWDSVSNDIEGLELALSKLGDSIGQYSRQILQQRYNENADSVFTAEHGNQYNQPAYNQPVQLH